MAPKATAMIEETRHFLPRKKTGGKMNGKNGHKKNSILEFAGVLSHEEAEEMRKNILELRKRSRNRQQRLWK